MSLINDALKKAQRMRSHEVGSAVPQQLASGSHQGPLRGRSVSAYWVVLSVAGAAVLVSVSVFATVYLLRKPVSSISIKSEDRVIKSVDSVSDTPKTEQTGAQQAEPPSLILPNSAPTETKPITLAAPLGSSPAKSLVVSPQVAKPQPESTTPARTHESVTKTTATASPKASAPAKTDLSVTPSEALPPPAALTQTKPNPLAQSFVDKLKVTGIRASGGESKVLMNDRVYRINDIVERSLGLRLVEASTERLVFTDENGLRYVRNF